MNLKQALQENKKQIDGYLSEYLSEKKSEIKEYDSELTTYIELIEKQILRSGKRIRPFILRQSYRLAGGENEDTSLKLGAAMELLHQYFLIHDDIVDRDEKRYGDLSLHKVFENIGGDNHFGFSMAMISGDYVNSLVYDNISNLETEDDVKIQLLNLLHKTIRDTVMGWKMHFFQNKTPITEASEEKYLKGMELVSAKYTFEAPMLMGLILQKNWEMASEMKRFAYLVGMAFQIQDDILGVFGDTKITGKPAGNDLREGKKTILIMRAYKNGDNEQKLYIEKYLGKNIEQKELDQLRDIITQTGSLKNSQDMANSYIDEALEILSNIDPQNTNVVELFEELAKFVLDRKS